MTDAASPSAHGGAATRYRKRYEDALFERVLPFWERHSPDAEHGGFFNCLDRDGSVYDTTKHAWMQGRQVWMLSTLYRTVRERPSWLAMARSGMDFLRTHALRPSGRVFYALTADGRPVSFERRRIFSECFYVMALAAFARAADEPEHLREAQDGLAQIWERAFGEETTEDGADGPSAYAGQPEAQSLAVPMILLNLLEEVAGDDWQTYTREAEACIARIKKHLHTETQTVREQVTPAGRLLDGPAGRLLNPGHGIEAGWFLRHWAERLDRPGLADVADDMVRWSFARGWDDEHGGLFCYLDAEGYAPVQLEWHMKLWWPHCEALYAHLLRYTRTGAASAWTAFEKTDRYAFSHFADREHGEWFGYLDRRGAATHRFKGGSHKGCFHVPRALWQCWRLLQALEER